MTDKQLNSNDLEPEAPETQLVAVARQEVAASLGDLVRGRAVDGQLVQLFLNSHDLVVVAGKRHAAQRDGIRINALGCALAERIEEKDADSQKDDQQNDCDGTALPRCSYVYSPYPLECARLLCMLLPACLFVNQPFVERIRRTAGRLRA